MVIVYIGKVRPAFAAVPRMDIRKYLRRSAANLRCRPDN